MKAIRSAKSLEITIILSDEELTKLDNGDSLEGEMRVQGLERGYSSKPLIITRGILKPDEIVERVLLPIRCTFETIQEYQLTMSNEAIERLKEKGSAGQRISEDKIIFYTEKY